MFDKLAFLFRCAKMPFMKTRRFMRRLTETKMGTIITTLILIALAGGLTYMAKTIVSGSSATRKPKRAGDGMAKTDADDLLDKPVATHDEVLQFWTTIMNDTTADVDTRLKASELLGTFHFGETGKKNG